MFDILLETLICVWCFNLWGKGCLIYGWCEEMMTSEHKSCGTWGTGQIEELCMTLLNLAAPLTNTLSYTSLIFTHQAIWNFCGGSLVGQTGTGKTETVKVTYSEESSNHFDTFNSSLFCDNLSLHCVVLII